MIGLDGVMHLGLDNNVLYNMPDVGLGAPVEMPPMPDLSFLDAAPEDAPNYSVNEQGLRRSGRVRTNKRAERNAREAGEVYKGRLKKAYRAEVRRQVREEAAAETARVANLPEQSASQKIDWEKVAKEDIDLSKQSAPRKGGMNMPGHKATPQEAGLMARKETQKEVEVHAGWSFAGLFTTLTVLFKGGVISTNLAVGGGVIIAIPVVAGLYTWLTEVFFTDAEIQMLTYQLKVQQDLLQTWEDRTGTTLFSRDDRFKHLSNFTVFVVFLLH